MITDEQAKLGQEVAKTTGKGIDLVQKVGSFVAKIGGEAFIGLGGIFNDRVQLWRYENLLAIQDRVDAIRQERKSQGKTTPIQPRSLIPLLEHASKEDDKTLQELWATLIANVTDADKGIELTKQFVEILSGLEPLDARMLLVLGKKEAGVPSRWTRTPLHQIQLALPGIDKANLYLSLDNLQRMGCTREHIEVKESLDAAHVYVGQDFPRAASKFQREEKTTYLLTHPGWALFQACSN